MKQAETKYATLFGGAMNITDSLEYKETVMIGELLVEKGYTVKNGGYRGMMEADTNGRGDDGFKEPTGARDIMRISTDLMVTKSEYQYLLMGRHLIEAGLKPSAEFGTILRASQEAQENGDFSDIEGALIWLNEHLHKNMYKESI